MAQLLIRNLSQGAVDELKETARKNKRSLEAEARIILEEAAAYQRRLADFREWSSSFREESRGLPQSDSVELLREDRRR